MHYSASRGKNLNPHTPVVSFNDANQMVYANVGGFMRDTGTFPPNSFFAPDSKDEKFPSDLNAHVTTFTLNIRNL